MSQLLIQYSVIIILYLLNTGGDVSGTLQKS